jgi:predicted Zn-dependent protease
MVKKAVVWLWLLFLAASCAVNPVTGKRELSLISEQQEIALGEQTDVEIRKQYGVYEESSLNDYVRSVGNALVPHTHRPQLTYHFAVLDSPIVNAFALPGGYIYVTRGILAMMNSEAELAVVLGHELGHVNARHSVRQMSKLMIVQIGMTLGSALSKTFAKISGVASLGMQLLFLKFSRDDEREADTLGVEYARAGGYNPGEMIGFFSSLQRLGDLSGKSTLPGFLSTHPLTSERIQNVKAMVSLSDSQLRLSQDYYLHQIENIVYGEDPREGYAEENIFYHPQLRFFFSFPKGWKVQNNPSQVILSSKDEDAALFLQAEKSGENLESYASQKVSSIEGRQFVEEQYLTINGLRSYHQLYDIVQPPNATLRTQLSFIKKGSYIFYFSALSAASDFSKYSSDFSSIVHSFSELQDRDHIAREPLRVKLMKANGRQILKEIFQNSGMKKDLWPPFAIMNGIEQIDVPASGKLIKIVK